MVRSLTRVAAPNAQPDEFEANELSEPTLQEADQWYTIFTTQADNTTTYGAGFGPKNENLNNDGWSDLDLQSAAGNDIDGKLRFRVYRDSSKEDLVAQSGKYSLSGLRSAVSSGRDNKVILPAMHKVVPRTDGFLTVEVRPTSQSTGEQVSASNSSTDLGIAYSEVPF